jgi:hypothetical protein
MTNTTLSIVVEMLEKIILGARDNEIPAMIADLCHSIAGDCNPQDIERLQAHLSTLTDNSLTARGLGLLIDTTHDLSSTLALQDLLQTIASRARSLVGADIAWLTILDEERDIFRTVTAKGNLSPATAEMTSNMEFGAVSVIMRTKRFFDTQDYMSDGRFKHSPHLDQIFRTESIVSLAGFPILSEGKVQGLLFVADRHVRKLSGREISVLGSFALHAGVALRNARTFEKLSEALAEAKSNRIALLQHIQSVEAAVSTHDQMTSLLAAGAELSVFMQRMANQIDGAVLYVDEALAVREEFAASGYHGRLASDLKSGKLDNATLISAISRSRHSGRSAMMLEVGDERSLAMALHGVSGRGESLIICHQGPLDPIDIRNLERSAVALSIAKLWSDKRSVEKLVASSTLLRHLVLVNPPDHSTIQTIRDRLNLRSDQSVLLVVIAITGLDRESQTSMVRDASARLNLLVDLVDDTYLAVGPEKPVRTLLRNFTQSQNNCDIGGILSEPFADLTQTATRYERVRQAFRVLHKMKRLNRFLEHSEVSLFARLFEAGDADRIERYIEQTLGPIKVRDPRQKTQLKRTLLSYFDSQYNIARTADVLGVHINTVRQRLETLKEITGGWEDPMTALELHVALRLDAITAPPSGA